MLDLLRALRKSNLLTEADWEQLQADVADRPLTSPDEVLQHLVAGNLLTPWQASMLRQGKKAFFLGKYRLEELLGTGAMGAVFRARQPGLDRSVTLKILSPRVVRDARMVARFRQEMRAIAALDDPHIVAALDAESANNLHYLVMRWVPGEDLARVLARHGPLPIPFACECVRQTALGLQHAADRGLVHRDLKPSNLLLSFDNETGGPFVRILDFGLARFLDLTSDLPPATGSSAAQHRSAESLTGHGLLLGTPDYIAPEQARDTRSADVRSDLFSLGCTLFRLLTNQVPFPGDTPRERLLAREQSPPPKPSRHRPEIPPALDRLVQRLLEPDPARRFPTPRALAQALAPFSDPRARLLATAQAPAKGATELGSTYTYAAPTTLSSSSQLALPPENSQLELFLDRLATEVEPGPRRTRGTTRRLWLALQRHSRQLGEFSRRHTRALLVTAAGGLLLLTAGGLLHRWSRPVLLVAWPREETPTGEVVQPRVANRLLPEAGTLVGEELRLTLAPGPVQLELRRDRYEPVREEWEARWFERRRITPDWQLTPGAVRQERARQLIANLEEGANANAPPGSALRVRWQEAVTFVRDASGVPEAAEVARALARQRGPFDSFSGGLGQSREPRAGWQAPQPGRVRYWPAGLAGTWNTVTDLALSAEPPRLAIASLDRTVTLYDPQGGVTLRTWELPLAPRQVRFLADQRTLVAVADEGGAVLLDPGQPDPSPVLPLLRPPLLPRPRPNELLARVALDAQREGFAVVELPSGRVLRQFGAWPADAFREATAVATANWVAVDLVTGVELWNAELGTLIQSIAGGHRPQFDEAGQRLAVSRVPNEVDVYALEPAGLARLQQTLESAGEPLQFLPAEAGLLTRGSRRVTVWGGDPLAERRTLVDLPLTTAVAGPARRLVSAEVEYGEWATWNLDSGESQRVAVAEPQQVLAFDPAGRYVAGGGSRQGWHVWPQGADWPAVEPEWSLPAALSPDGTFWAARSGTQLQIRDTRDGSVREGWSAVLQETDDLQFSPSGELLAVTGGTGLFRRGLRVWRVAEESELPLPDLGEARVRGVAFHEPRSELLLAREGQSLAACHWPSGTVRELEAKWPAEIVSLGCDGRGQLLAVGCEDRSLWLYDRESGKQTRLKGVTTRVRKWTFSRDGRWLAGLGADRVWLFALETGRVVGNFPETPGGANDVQFDWQCQSLAVATNTGAVVVFALPRGKPTGPWRQRSLALGPAAGRVWQVCFSADGRHLVTLNGDRAVEVRRVADVAGARE